MESKLIACPVCQSEVSSGAMSCPSCGEVISGQQKYVNRAVLAWAKSASDSPILLLKLFGWMAGWIIGLLVWASLAASFPKTISILTVLCCIGHVSEGKKNKSIRSVKWVRVVIALVLSVTFFVASFYQ